MDEEWDDTQPPERPPAEVPYAVPPVRQSYTGQSSPEAEPEQRPTRRHLVQPPRGDETDDGEDEDEDAPPSKRRRAADDEEAPQRASSNSVRPWASPSRAARPAKALTRGDVAHAVSMLVESETRGVAASRPRSRAGKPAPAMNAGRNVRTCLGLSRTSGGGSGFPPCALRRSRYTPLALVELGQISRLSSAEDVCLAGGSQAPSSPALTCRSGERSGDFDRDAPSASGGPRPRRSPSRCPPRRRGRRPSPAGRATSS